MLQENAPVIVQLPQERTRAVVKKVVDDSTIIVELTATPLAKTHTYKLGDIVGCRRKFDGIADIWEAQREPVIQPMENKDAAPAGKGSDRSQHKPAAKRRKAAPPGNRHRTVKRKTPSHGAGRKRAAKH